MRNASLTLALAAAATLAAPSGAQAQLTEAVGRVLNGGVDTRTSTRVDARTGVRRESARDARDVPPGHLPGPGSCRVWIDGVPPGRQPRPTDCTTAERDAIRYGGRARVIYGAQTRGTYDPRASRSGRTYDTVINGRRCRVREWYDGQGRLRQNTVCEGDRSWPNGTRDGRRDDRDSDDDSDRLNARERELKRQKQELKRERKELKRERRG